MTQEQLNILDRKINILNSILNARPHLTMAEASKAAEDAYTAMCKRLKAG